MSFNGNSDFTDVETEAQRDLLIFHRPMQKDSNAIA